MRRTAITVEHSQDSFGDLGAGVDVEASIDRFGELLTRRIRKAHLVADVDVSWTVNDVVRVITPDGEGEDDIRETVEEQIADLFGDFEAWLVMDKPAKLPSFTCLRCGHTWNPRRPETPRICPLCKTAYWNTPRR